MTILLRRFNLRKWLSQPAALAMRQTTIAGIACFLALATGGYLWWSTTSNLTTDSFIIDTSGTAGSFRNDTWEVTLPLMVDSGLDYPIHAVEMIVEVYSCTSQHQPISQCKPFTSFSEVYTKDIGAHSKLRQVHTRAGTTRNAHAGNAARFIKVRSTMFSMVDARSLEAEEEQKRLESLRFP
jgi:hypothetical protein